MEVEAFSRARGFTRKASFGEDEQTACGDCRTGAKVVSTARYVAFQLAEVAIPRSLVRAILERIGRLRLPETVPG